jgi:hypothetical protein
MGDTLTVASLATGIVLLVASSPGFKVATQLIRIKREDFNFPMWDRLILIAVATVLLSLAVYGIASESTKVSESTAGQLAFAPAGVLFLYSLALWTTDTLVGWKKRSKVELTAKLGPMFVLLFVPFLVPALLWAY